MAAKTKDCTSAPAVTFQPERFKATYNGDVLGWFDTVEQARAAINQVRDNDFYLMRSPFQRRPHE
jgi:hypothetical protein